MAACAPLLNVSTRIFAAFIAVVPLYLVGLFASYVATQIEVVYLNHQSKGTYLYYFHRFLPPSELFYSLVKAVVFAKERMSCETELTFRIWPAASDTGTPARLSAT